MALDKKMGVDPKLLNKAYSGMKKRKMEMGKKKGKGCAACDYGKKKCNCQ
jgi:hypothetical protein